MTVDAAALARLARRLDPRPNPYRADPVGWIHHRASEITTADQERISASIVERKYTAVRSCNGVGKSHLASRIAGWWIDTHPVGEAVVVSTAPTAAQVGAVLWRYIGNLHRKVGDMPGYITGDNTWKVNHPGSAPEPIAWGRKPADTSPEDLAGLHARYMLVIIDEAGGVPRSLYNTAISLATSENSRLFAIGNPDDPGSYFYEICKPGSNWHVIHLDALRSPNMTVAALEPYPQVRELMAAEGIEPHAEEPPQEIREMLVSPAWVAERIKDYGVGTPAWDSKVRGRFPEVTIDTLIPPHFVEMAKQRWETARAMPTQAQYGYDIARYGTDKTILCLRQGPVAEVVLEIARGPITEAAGALMAHAQEHFAADGHMLPPVAVDDTGVGGGVTDILKEQGYPVIPVVAGARATQLLPSVKPGEKGKPRFNNLRSELLWNVREALGGPSGSGDDGWLALDPADDKLHAQLTSMKFRYNSAGQIEVESKDSMRSRGLPSPDRADALSYTLAPEPAFTTVQGDRMLTGGLMDARW